MLVSNKFFLFNHITTITSLKNCFLLQVVQGEVEVVTTEMTVGIGIPLEGVIMAVLETGITTEVMTMDQIKLLVQMHRMEAMGVVTATATASVAAATMVMDSPTLTTKLAPLEVRTTSRVVPKTVQPIPLSPSPRHRLHSSTRRRWCPTPCLLSSLSKHTLGKSKLLLFLSCSKFDIQSFCIYRTGSPTTSASIKPFKICSAALVALHTCFLITI